MIAKGMSKKYGPLETFSEIFEGLEGPKFKRPFKKPQVVDDF
jgi:hypothetical protein